MGCDIHLEVEVFRDGVWRRVPGQVELCLICDGTGCVHCDHGKLGRSFYEDRNYSVFAALADVRNDGTVAVIARSRGLPADISTEAAELVREYSDHSFSWLTMAEVIAYDWAKNVGIYRCNRFMDVVRGQLLPLGDPRLTRIVFGFDS